MKKLLSIWTENFNDKYTVESNGNIYSIRRKLNLKPRQNTNGYLAVHLYNDSFRKAIDVHRLVGLIWCENDDPENKTQINHKDGNKLNNDHTNLEWVTPSQNQKHMIKLELSTVFKGEDKPTAILNNVKVLEIREKLANGAKNIDLAKEYGVDDCTISQIKHRKKWKHI